MALVNSASALFGKDGEARVNGAHAVEGIKDTLISYYVQGTSSIFIF